MHIFPTLTMVIEEAALLTACGHFPTIYLVADSAYALNIEREWPPQNSRPALKWTGEDWMLVPNSMQTLEEALVTCRYFADLGYDAVAVDFQGISYDVFLAPEHVPRGAWIVSSCPEEEVVHQE